MVDRGCAQLQLLFAVPFRWYATSGCLSAGLISGLPANFESRVRGASIHNRPLSACVPPRRSSAIRGCSCQGR
eukprot:11629578-Alexandrium_andersonii.AAC.1